MKESSYLEGREHLVEKFKTIPFIRSFDPAYIREILKLSRMRKYDPGEIIIPEGTFDSWVYVVISGEVQVIKQGNQICKLDEVGTVFGEMAVIDGEARCASVQATKETLCLAFDASLMERLEPQDRNTFYLIFYRLVAEVLANRLRSTNEELTRTRGELEALKKSTAKVRG